MVNIKKQFFIDLTLLILTIYIFMICPILVKFSASFYIYILNPILWFVIVLFIYITLFDSAARHWHYKREIIQYSVIAALSYIIIYFMLGLFSGYGKNPFDNTPSGILLNVWSLGTVIFMREYIRTVVLNSVKDKDRKVVFAILVILFTISDMNLTNFGSYFENNIAIFKFIVTILFPSIVQNSVFNYLSMRGGFYPMIIYRFLTISAIWVAPILPKHDWMIIALIDTLIPFFMFLLVDHQLSKADRRIPLHVLKETGPKSWIPSFIVVILTVGFVIGMFPWTPITILTRSMYPKINVGDVVIVKKMDISDLRVGDVVQYKLDKIFVIHRIIEKYQYKGAAYVVTKGDNNKQKDYLPVSASQISGKVVLKIPYIGYPSIWFSGLIGGNNQDIGVETGH